MANMLAWRKRLIIFELESTYGTDPTPTGADVIQCANLDFKPLAGSQVNREIILPYFGNLGFLRVENYCEISFDVEMQGLGTAGTAPAYSKLLKACNISETVTAAPITGTAQAGGSTTTIKLASGASAVDDYYVGMSVEITGGTGDGQTGVIIAYDGTTKIATVAKTWAAAPDATSEYSIGANVLYTLNSNFGVSTANTAGTFYFNIDGVQHIMLGARGSVAPMVNALGIPVFRFRFLGLHGTISDAAAASVSLLAFKLPTTVSTANTTDLHLLGFEDAVFKTLELDVGNELTYRQVVGRESVLITGRAVTGKMSIEATKVADHDWWTIAKNGTYGKFCVKHGQTAGYSTVFTGRNVQLTEPAYSEDKGVAMMDFGMSFAPYGSAGNDEFRICFQ
jgi:hypothetical protein